MVAAESELAQNHWTVLNRKKHLLSTMAWNMAALSGLVLTFNPELLHDLASAYVKVDFCNHDLELAGPRSDARRDEIARAIDKAIAHPGGLSIFEQVVASQEAP